MAITGPFPSGVTGPVVAADVIVGSAGVSRGGVDTGVQALDRIRETVRNVFRFINGLILIVGTVLFHLRSNTDRTMIESFLLSRFPVHHPLKRSQKIAALFEAAFAQFREAQIDSFAAAVQQT